MRLTCISVLASVAILWQSALAAPAKPEPAASRAAGPASAPAGRPAAVTTRPSSPFDSMDDATVAKNLQDFGMGELLAALAEEDANSPDIAKRAVACDVMLDQAGKVPEQKTADQIIDRASKILDGLIAATQNAKDFVGKANYYKLRMTKINAEGMGRIQLCTQRMQYLLDSPADRERIIRYADVALKAMADLETDINAELANWRAIPEARVTGALYQLEELQRERRIRDGWLQFYRAAATPDTVANKQQRGDMLNIAIDSAKDLLAVGDANDPARAQPALLAGMACREMHKPKEAADYFDQMAKVGTATDQLRAMFEKAHTAIESGGTVADGLAAIVAFQKKAQEANVGRVAIAMQSTLLKSHLYEAQAEALKASDPIKSKKMAAQSIAEIMGFINANPAYMPAFLEFVGPRYEGQNVDDLPAQVVVALGLWHGTKNTPASAVEAERLLKNALARTTPLDQNTGVMALGEMGRLFENQKRYTEAAAAFCKLADTYPQDRHGKAAAIEAVKCMDRVINPKDAKPTDPKPGDEDVAMYTQALLVVMKHWGDKRPENKDVQIYHYLLGVQLENVSKAAEAIQEFELVPSDSPVNILARYHALGLRASVMMDTPPAKLADRQYQAKELIAKAAAFHEAVVGFKTEDKDQAKSLRTMGAEMDLMAAQVCLQILKQTSQARTAAEKVLTDWPGMSDIADRATVIQVQAYLAEKNLQAAIGLMDKMKENTAVMAQVVKEIRLVIERLDPVKDEKELKELMSVFPQFAEKVFEAAKAAVAANPKAPPDAMYPYSQVKALAYEYTDDKEKNKQGLDIYVALNKQKKDDAINIRGMARCYRKLGANMESMNCYNQLVNGLRRLSPDWWKAQLERAQFCVEANSTKTDEIRKVLLELRRLSDEDATMGGMAAKFKEVQAKGRQAVPTATAPAPTKPAVAAKPAPAKGK